MTPLEAQRQIFIDLKALGVPQGAAVLVHSSLKSLGPVPDGPETVIRGLVDALGPQGTLLFPALSYATVSAKHPLFDVKQTPCCVGALPEYFRKRIGTQRSVCPTHSVCAVGPQAQELLGRHHLDQTPCGPNSPFRLLREADGFVLFLGCGTAPNTSMHGVEELVEPPYLFGRVESYSVIAADGTRSTQLCRAHHFAGYKQRYDRIEALLQAGELQRGKVLAGDAVLMRCRPMWERALVALKRDPLFFVEKIPPQS